MRAESPQSAPARDPRARRSRDVLTPLIGLIAMLAVALVAYGQFSTMRIARDQDDLLPIADGVASQISAAHLYLVQAIGGNEAISLQDDVFARITQAARLIDIAEDGGRSMAGHEMAPVDQGPLAERLRLLAAQVDSFNTQATYLWLHRNDSGRIGTRSSQDLNRLYTSILGQASLVSSDIERDADEQRARIQLINASVLVFLGALFGVALVSSRRTRRTIVVKTAELEDRVHERTAELARSEARMAAIVTTAVDSIITFDADGIIRSVNPATEQIFGYPSSEIEGQSLGTLMGDEDLARRARAPGAGHETIARRADGSMFQIDISVSEARVEEDRIFVGLIRDITDRKRFEAELQAAKAAAEDAATHDPLTGLWNHNRIIDVLIEELSRGDRQEQPVSLAMFDLDHFKRINDTHGHVVGDEVLREVARRLERSVRAYDEIGRFGGEEFMIVFPGIDAGHAHHAAERIREAIGEQPILTGAGLLKVTASLGIVTHTGALDGDATELLMAADSALYEAKTAGRDRVAVGSV